MYRRQAFVPPFNALEYVMAISFAVNKSMRECLASKSRRGQTGKVGRLAWAFKIFRAMKTSVFYQTQDERLCQ